MTRILVFTDEPVLASGLEAVLKSQSEFEWAATCLQVSEIAETAAASQPDILLIDFTPEVTFALLLDLQVWFPATRIVLWARSIAVEVAHQAIEHGIRGILKRTLPVESVTTCMRVVAAGGLWFDKSLEASLRDVKKIALTPRESQLVSLLTSGLKNKEIATTLFLAEGTVKVYLSRLFQKLGVNDRFELALYGLRNKAGLEGATAAGQTQTTQPQSRNPGGAQRIHTLVIDRPALRA